MGTEQLKSMKEQLMGCVQGQLSNIQQADTHELGEAVDMIKDLAEAIYYCTITESMEKVDQKQEMRSPVNVNYYTSPMMDGMNNRGMERSTGYMYYPNSGGGTMHYTELPDNMWRDPREGRSPMRRRTYMEGKEMHKDTNSQLRELEAYLQELSSDITEMIRDASPEEKAILQKKMNTLASKIV